MKTLKFGLVAIVTTALLTLSGCSVQSGLASYDDVYYNPSDAEQYQEVEKRQSNYNNEKQNQYAKNSRAYNERLRRSNTPENNQIQDTNYYEQDSLNYKSDNQDGDYIYYNEDDYYDYAYSARIRRFHRPYVWSDYYDDYYTNLYWYTYNPYYWGTSIYLGYSWWYPSYYHHNPYWGYSYWGWGYNNFYNPYYYGWGYYPYGNVCYYNQRDHNSNFNRPRSSFDPNNRYGISNSRTGHLVDDGSKRTFGQTYNERNRTTPSLNNGTISRDGLSRTSNSSIANNRTKPLERAGNRTIGNNIDFGQKKDPNNRTQGRFNKPERLERRDATPQNNRTINNERQNNQNSNARFNNNRTDNSNNRRINTENTNRNTRTYTPPSSRQPRTNNEFRTNTRRSNDFQQNRRTIDNSNNNRSIQNNRTINTNRSNDYNKSTNSTPSRSYNSSPTRSSSSSSSSGSSRSSGSSSSGGSRSGGSRR